ncbi:unnamed protein product [Spirodela intermedia]|uniref:DUF7138 domain-containing protein n=1 Tax=Spirodela intermedia TaxID=51605 RepID=A0A7I8KHW6_SPIIN|nr:unnamed protein product [Spirodela intermedia]
MKEGEEEDEAAATSLSTVALRLVFANGSREVDVGEVAIDPGLGFRRLQFLVCDRIGVPAEQISLFLALRRKARSSLEGGKRTPIDERTDFAALVREKDGVVLAQLKQMKKDRRVKTGRNLAREEALSARGKKSPPSFPEKTILRRPSELPSTTAAAALPVLAENGQGLMGPFNYESLRNLQIQRERYLLSTAPAAVHRPYTEAAPPPPPTAGDAAVAVCELCSSAKETPVPFHCCVLDEVVAEAFRSPAGPIQRPPPKALPPS